MNLTAVLQMDAQARAALIDQGGAAIGVQYHERFKQLFKEILSLYETLPPDVIKRISDVNTAAGYAMIDMAQEKKQMPSVSDVCQRLSDEEWQQAKQIGEQLEMNHQRIFDVLKLKSTELVNIVTDAVNRFEQEQAQEQAEAEETIDEPEETIDEPEETIDE
jgi:hypothetical protein